MFLKQLLIFILLLLIGLSSVRRAKCIHRDLVHLFISLKEAANTIRIRVAGNINVCNKASVCTYLSILIIFYNLISFFLMKKLN